jgi:hypothetical protein
MAAMDGVVLFYGYILSAIVLVFVIHYMLGE